MYGKDWSRDVVLLEVGRGGARPSPTFGDADPLLCAGAPEGCEISALRCLLLVSILVPPSLFVYIDRKRKCRRCPSSRLSTSRKKFFGVGVRCYAPLRY